MYSINVLMSTYNGEKYLKEQIDSIFMQQDVKIYLTVRDDGSKDSTLKILKEMQDKYSDRMSIFYGENIGYRQSFLQLLKLSTKADYYAFSDQDDIWLPKKCICAIKKLDAMDCKIGLYASSLIIVDSDLNIISFKNIKSIPNSIESYFTRARLAGCTYLFTANLKKMVEEFCDLKMPSAVMPDHDFVVGACAFACGKVYLDDESNILHRRHYKSITSGGNGIIKRIKVEWAIVFGRKNEVSTLTRLLLEKYSYYMEPSTKDFLCAIAGYKNDIRQWLNLIKNPKMKTNIWICDAENRLKIFLRRY